MAERKIGGDVKAAVGLAVVITLIGVVIANSTVSVILAPFVFLFAFYAMAKSPIRLSMMTLLFLALVLENPEENPASGTYQSPFFYVGAILLTHLNAVDRSLSFISWCPFSGMDLCLIVLGLVALHRRSTGSTIDSRDRVATPAPLPKLARLSLAGTAFVWVIGLMRGGDFNTSLWQLNRVVYLPVIFLLFHLGLRGPLDHRAFARVVIAAAVLRSTFAYYVATTVVVEPDMFTGRTAPAYATSHHDSMLFAAAFVIIAAGILLRVRPSILRLAVIVLPILAIGIWANNRRMAWVQVGVVMLMIYFVSPDNPVKKKIRRLLYASAPILAGYVAIGWSSTSRIFAPVQIMRSVVDAQSDQSSFWREMENFNLVFSFQQNPIFGAGYGHKYQEVVPLPAVPYPLEYYAPHNSILGLWAFCGFVGFTTLTLLWGAGIFYGLLGYHRASDPALKVAGLVSSGMVLIYLLQCWGDMGLGSWGGVFMVGAAFAVSGKLAAAVGAWGSAGGTVVHASTPRGAAHAA